MDAIEIGKVPGHCRTFFSPLYPQLRVSALWNAQLMQGSTMPIFSMEVWNNANLFASKSAVGKSPVKSKSSKPMVYKEEILKCNAGKRCSCLVCCFTQDA